MKTNKETEETVKETVGGETVEIAERDKRQTDKRKRDSTHGH